MEFYVQHWIISTVIIHKDKVQLVSHQIFYVNLKVMNILHPGLVFIFLRAFYSIRKNNSSIPYEAGASSYLNHDFKPKYVLPSPQYFYTFSCMSLGHVCIDQILL